MDADRRFPQPPASDSTSCPRTARTSGWLGRRWSPPCPPGSHVPAGGILFCSVGLLDLITQLAEPLELLVDLLDRHVGLHPGVRLADGELQVVDDLRIGLGKPV